MGEERVCHTCWTRNERGCVFEREARCIAGEPGLTAEEKHEIVTEMRKEARRKECPGVNFDPDYEGKDKL